LDPRGVGWDQGSGKDIHISHEAGERGGGKSKWTGKMERRIRKKTPKKKGGGGKNGKEGGKKKGKKQKVKMGEDKKKEAKKKSRAIRG